MPKFNDAAYPNDPTPGDDSILLELDDPAGTPTTKQVTVGAIKGSLPALTDGAGTVVDTATTGLVKIDLAADVSVSSVKLAGDTVVTAARVATTAALPACTYANGSSGVGATLTGNSNGALPAIDNTTVAANDRILVCVQAAPEQNGVYLVTTVGDGSNPFVLTRAANTDEAGDYQGGIIVSVAEGLGLAGNLYRSRPTTVTIGTTAIRWAGPPRPGVTPADIAFGTMRDRIRTFSDFDEFDATVTTTANHIPATAFSVVLTGTAAQAAQAGGSEARPGVLDLQTGTTTTGAAGVAAHNSAGLTFDTTKRLRFYALAKTPTVSDGTDTYSVRLGAIVGINVAILAPSGLYFKLLSTGNVLAVARHSGTETVVDSGLAQTTGYRSYIILYDEAATTAWFYVGATLITPTGISTNLPSGDSFQCGANILKSAGTTSRSLYVDAIETDTLDARSLNVLVP